MEPWKCSDCRQECAAGPRARGAGESLLGLKCKCGAVEPCSREALSTECLKASWVAWSKQPFKREGEHFL